MTKECKIVETGNGFPNKGDFVSGYDGNLYKIVAMGSVIHTNQRGNYLHASVVAANWHAVDEAFESLGRVKF